MESLPNNLIGQPVILSEAGDKKSLGYIRLIYKEGTDIICIVQPTDGGTYVKRILTTLKNQ